MLSIVRIFLARATARGFRLVDTIITESGGEPWRLTCVYGEAQFPERHKTWEMLKFIKASSHLPWMCIGDFNEVLLQSEHEEVQERSRS